MIFLLAVAAAVAVVVVDNVVTGCYSDVFD